MSNWIRTLKSPIGTKALMAITGLVLFGFVIVHMLGNLQVFLGAQAVNDYAHFLKSKPALLWGARAFLAATFVVHVLCGLRLTRENRAARPVRYAVDDQLTATWASRHMMLTGAVLLAFIVYHLLHFTVGFVESGIYQASHKPPTPSLPGGHDVFEMFVRSFQKPAVTIGYVVANVVLGIHLWHGGSSMFQTLGINHPRYDGLIRKVGPVLGTLVAAGNVAMPLACLVGIVRLPQA